MYGSSKKLADSDVRRPLSSPESKQFAVSTTHCGHSPDVTYDASWTRSVESAPPAFPVSPAPSHAFTRPLVVNTEAQKPSSAPALSLAGSGNQLSSDVPPDKYSPQPSGELRPTVANAPSSDSSADYYIPETRAFTVCKQATHPPLIETPEIEPLPLAVRPNLLSTKEGPLEVGSSADVTERPLLRPTGSVARSCVFSMNFSATTRRPNIAPTTVQAPRRTSTSERRAQPPPAQDIIAQQQSDEVPVRRPTIESTPLPIVRSRPLLEEQVIAENHELAVQHRQGTGQVPIKDSTTEDALSSVVRSHQSLAKVTASEHQRTVHRRQQMDHVTTASAASKSVSSSIAQSRPSKEFTASIRQRAEHLEQESAYVRKPIITMATISALKPSQSAVESLNKQVPVVSLPKQFLHGNITLSDMAESFNGKNWMRQAESTQFHAKIPEVCHVYDSQQQPQAVEERQEDRVSYNQRCFYPVALCVFMAAFLLVFTVVLWPVSEKRPPGLLSTCSSASCLRDVLYLDNLLSWEQEKPCNDFYSFVCSNWTSRFAAGSFLTEDVSTDDDYAVYLERRLLALIQDRRGPMSDLHAKCMNIQLINDEGWEPLLQLLHQVSLEGFPLTPPIRKISVWRTAAKLVRMTGASALLGVGVASHPSEAGKDVVSVGPPEMLTSDAVHVDINHAISLYTMSVFAAKKALSKQFVPPVYATNVVKFATNIEKLGEVRPQMGGEAKMDIVNGQSPFLEFLTEVFADTKTSLFSGEGSDVLTESPRIVNKVIKLVTSEEAHTVLNYLCVRLMIQTSAFIPESELTSFYATMVYGKRRDAIRRWELCVRVVDKALFPLVSASLLAQLRAPVAKYADLARDITTAFQRSTDASPYFDASSKSAVRSLLAGTQMRVFGPQWLSEPSLLDSYERSLPAIKKDQNGLETFMALHEYTFLDSLARGSAQRWRRSAFAFDCWYEPHPNTVYVPLLAFNVLQDFAGGTSPLQIPRAGPRVGKCLFDMLMLHLSPDEAPEKQGDNWLTAPTRAKLQDVESCLEGVEASVATGFDRFRDVLVLRAAHDHFRESEANTSKALSLRLKNGRMLTDDQLFFIFAMLQTCRKSADQKLRAEAGYGWLVALRNNDDFAASYNCSKDEPMNPDHKC